MRTLFTIQCNVDCNGDNTEGTVRQSRREVEQVSEDDNDMDSDSYDDVDANLEAWGKYWMYLNYVQFLSIEYQTETVLEIARYCLVEPLPLRDL